jgi:hypothetical protein
MVADAATDAVPNFARSPDRSMFAVVAMAEEEKCLIWPSALMLALVESEESEYFSTVPSVETVPVRGREHSVDVARTPSAEISAEVETVETETASTLPMPETPAVPDSPAPVFLGIVLPLLVVANTSSDTDCATPTNPPPEAVAVTVRDASREDSTFPSEVVDEVISRLESLWPVTLPVALMEAEEDSRTSP